MLFTQSSTRKLLLLKISFGMGLWHGLMSNKLGRKAATEVGELLHPRRLQTSATLPRSPALYKLAFGHSPGSVIYCPGNLSKRICSLKLCHKFAQSGIFAKPISCFEAFNSNMPTPIPFSEPPWLLGLPSPIFKETHRKWQANVRAFVEKNLLKEALEWERAEAVPSHVFETFASANMLIPCLPAPLPVAWLKRLGIHELLGGLKVEDFDYLHGLIYADEMARSGITGPCASLTTGMSFGVPPIVKFGDQQLQERFLPQLLRGEKRSCIAITEPDAGSDVAGITTTAVKSADGKHYIINGTKKWITNGIWTVCF